MDTKPKQSKQQTEPDFYKACVDCGTSVRVNNSSPEWNYPDRKFEAICVICYMRRCKESEMKVGHFRVTPDGTGY
jgi:hypothetical protein